jgi:hypothetical protein
LDETRGHNKIYKATKTEMGSPCNENGEYKYQITEWTPYKTRPAGTPRLRWMDQVEEDLKRMKITGWRAKVEDRQEWNRIVEQSKTHPGL